MKLLFTVLTINKMVKRNKPNVKRSIFAISKLVVEISTLLAKIIIFPFAMYKKYKKSQVKEVSNPENVISFSDYKRKIS